MEPEPPVQPAQQSPAQSPPIILLVASIAVLSVGMPAALLATVPNIERSGAWVLSLLVMVWGGVRLSLLWVRGDPRLFDFFFWLYTYIFMGIAPTVQIRSGLTSTTTPGMDPVLDLPAALIVVLGIGCYEISRLVWWLARRRHTSMEISTAEVSPARAVLLMGAGLLFTVYFVAKVGLGPTLGSREAAFAARQAAWPDPPIRSIFYALATYPLLIAIGALNQARTQIQTPPLRWATVGVIGVGLVLLLAVVNPIASARYTFGTVAFALVAFAGALRTRFRVRMSLLGVIFAFLFLFPIADAFRYSSGVRTTRGGFFAEYESNPDYDSFWQIGNAISFWVDGLVEPLRQLLGSLFFWVPRSIWPDKPTDTGAMLANYRGYSFDNLSAPLWAELLTNGGVVAVVIGFLILGPLLSAMDGRMNVSFSTDRWWALVGGVIPVYMTILLRGSLLQATGSLVITIACLLWVRQSPPESRTGP